MRHSIKSSALLVLVLGAMACGGSSGGITPPPPPAPKPDPYLTVRVRNELDTTTAVGRADWHIYALLTGPYTAQNGVAYQGDISLGDIRLNHTLRCISVGSDSVGQRLLVTFAIADTTTELATPQASADAIVTSWYNGNHTLPAGWDALFITPRDAFVSDQYTAGHGLTRTDPIKWGWDWTGNGDTSFYERTETDTDANSCNVAL